MVPSHLSILLLQSHLYKLQILSCHWFNPSKFPIDYRKTFRLHSLTYKTPPHLDLAIWSISSPSYTHTEIWSQSSSAETFSFHLWMLLCDLTGLYPLRASWEHIVLLRCFRELCLVMKVLWNVEHLFDLLVLNLGENSAPK